MLSGQGCRSRGEGVSSKGYGQETNVGVDLFATDRAGAQSFQLKG